MVWLLDTNILSELHRPKPEQKVLAFVAAQPLELLYVSSVTSITCPSCSTTCGFCPGVGCTHIHDPDGLDPRPRGSTPNRRGVRRCRSWRTPKEAIGHGVRAKRSKSGAISFGLHEAEADH